VKKFIVIPEAVKAGPDGLGIGEPSFIFRQVLEFTLRLAGPADEVYLAPANAFGGTITEEEAARAYLERQQAPFRILHPGFNLPPYRTRPRYIDTLDNARLLRESLGSAGGGFELICANRHTARALWCFRQSGFQFDAVHRVPLMIEPEAVPARVFYYRYPLLHRLYESAALMRDMAGSLSGLRR
jgi:uncharacterized SAM-binding protein YcdF (DUF218 family)